MAACLLPRSHLSNVCIDCQYLNGPTRRTSGSQKMIGVQYLVYNIVNNKVG